MSLQTKNLLENIKEWVEEEGMELVGAIDARPLEKTRQHLAKRQRQGRITPFESTDFSIRTNPRSFLNRAASILVLALPYQLPSPSTPIITSEPKGKVARFAQGPDYHRVFKEKALRVLEFIKKDSPRPFSYRLEVDKTPLVERALAQKAGGTTGKNTTYISPHYGSWVILGEIILDLLLPEYKSTSGKLCTGCGSCQKACPTGALDAKGLDPFQCVSYLTQQRGFLSPELRKKLDLHTYGCDLCQEACPANLDVPVSSAEETGHLLFSPEPLLLPFLNMSKKEFDLTVGLTSAGWCGRRTLQRNAIINLGNAGDDSAAPFLGSILKQDPRREIRSYSAWSLGRIGTASARRELEASFTAEKEEEVQNEIRAALTGI